MPTSFLGREVKVGDIVAWAVGTRTWELRVGRVVNIEGKNLRCRLYNEGKPTVEASRVVHVEVPDFSSAIGKRADITINYPSTVTSTWGGTTHTYNYDWSSVKQEQIIDWDDESYWAFYMGERRRVLTDPISVLRGAK